MWLVCGLSACRNAIRSNHKKPRSSLLLLTVTGITEGEPQTVTGSWKAANRRSTRTLHARSHKPLATHSQPHPDSLLYTTSHARTTHQARQHGQTTSQAEVKLSHANEPSQATPVPHHTTPRRVTPRQKQTRPHQARPLGQRHFQFKEKVVDARASPVASLLIQWGKGCDEGRGLVMDVRTVVTVAGTSWCGTVHEQDVRRSHVTIRGFRFLFFGCSLLAAAAVAASVTASYCSSNTAAQHLPMLRLRLRGLPLLPHLLQFLLTLLPLTLHCMCGYSFCTWCCWCR